jgi:4-amino-4-deoxy-L-arabinose transferase-like glycosyltransferase
MNMKSSLQYGWTLFSRKLQKKHLILVLLALILAIGAFLRLTHFEERARFNADQVRDAKIVDAMFEGTFPLLGPKAGGTEFHLSPAFYYLEYASGFLFGQDPAGIAFFVPLLSIASIALFFILFRLYFSPSLTLVLTSLYSLSFYTIKYSRFAWNPNAIPFFLFAFLLLSLKLLDEKERTGKYALLWYSLLGIVIGIAAQLHTTLLILLPLLFVGYSGFLLWNKRPLNIKHTLITIGIVVLFHLPFLVFDFTHNGTNTLAFLQGAQNKTTQSVSLFESIALDTAFFIQSSVYILSGLEPEKDWLNLSKLFNSHDLKEIVLFLGGVLFFSSGLYLTRSRIRHETEPQKRRFLFLILTFSGALFLIFLPIAETLNLRFSVAIIFFPLFLLGLLMERLFQSKRKYHFIQSCLVSLFLISLAITNIWLYSKTYDFEHYTLRADTYGGISMGESRGLSEFVEQALATEIENKEIFLFPFEFKRSLEYFLEKDGRSVYETETGKDRDVLHFLIAETEKAERTRTHYDCCYDVLGSDAVGRFTIYTLRPKAPGSHSEACRIGLITDVHASYSKSSKYFIRNESALPLLSFVEHMNQEFRPDVTIELGDFIDGSEDNNERGLAVYTATEKLYTTLQAPTLHVMGNHETRGGGITTDQWLTFAKQDQTYYSYSCKDTELIVLDGNNAEIRKQTGEQFKDVYFIDDAQMKWFETTLRESTAKKKMVFIHEPLWKRSEFQSASRISGDKDIRPEDVKKLQALFKKYGVDAVFSGHVEVLDHQTIDSTDYYTLPGIFKSKDLNVSWLETFYEITSTENSPVVKMFYKKEKDTAYQSVFIPSLEYQQLTR